MTARAQLACVLTLLLGASGSAAALQVVTQGPRSGALGVQLRQAFAEAGVTNARVVVQVRRGHPSWGVSISVYRPGTRQPVLVVGLRTRGGHVSDDALARIAKRVAPLLARGRPEAPRPKPEDRPPPDAQPEPQAKTDPPEPPEAAPEPPPPPRPTSARTSGKEKEIDFDTEEEPVARKPKPAKKPARPPPEPDGDERPARRREAPLPRVERRADPETPLDRVVARIDAGVGLAHRRFLLDWAAAGIDYETGIYSQVFVHGEAYPLQLLTANPISRLGVRLGYETSAGLSTEDQPGNPLSSSLTTTVRRFWAGLSFLFPPFRNKAAPRFDLRVGLHHTDFEIEANTKVQDLSLTTLAPGGGMTWPFRSYLNLALSAEYRALIRARNDVVERYQPGTAALQGVFLEAAVLGKIFAGLGYRLSFSYERLAGDLPDPAGGEALIVRDRYLAGDLALYYEL